MPTFSIVLPTYDRRNFLLEAVASVRNQTIENWELIVVDDGSTDGSTEAVEALDDPRVSVVRQARRGPGAARNAGIARAAAPWIAFLDSDDLWGPGHLATAQAKLASAPEAKWWYCAADLRSSDGKPFPGRRQPPVFPEGAILADLLSFRARVITSGVVVDRDLTLRLGGFDETMIRGQDFDLWLKLAAAAPATASADLAATIRKHEQHARRSAAPEAMVYEERVRMYETLLASPAGKAFAGLCRRRIARYSATMALCHLVAGERRLALRGARRAVRRQPTSPRAWLTLLRVAIGGAYLRTRLRRTAISSR